MRVKFWPDKDGNTYHKEEFFYSSAFKKGLQIGALLVTIINICFYILRELK